MIVKCPHCKKSHEFNMGKQLAKFKSEASKAASAMNGKKGGRPKKLVVELEQTIPVIDTSKAPLFMAVIGSAVGSTEFVPVTTLNQASAGYRGFINSHNLGSRDAGSCFIYQNGKVVAHVSYNGNVWEGESHNPEAIPIFEH